MKDSVNVFPVKYQHILADTHTAGFDQLSEPQLGSFLATLAASKVNGRFLELGTGSGISTVWILHGMDSRSELITIDSDANLLVASKYNL